MLLALDIGNTRTKGGLFYRGQHIDTFHFTTPRDSAGWHAGLRSLLADIPVEEAGMTSVVPLITPLAIEALHDLFGVSMMEITHQIRLPFVLAYSTPETLGTDRLAAAAAAWTRFGTLNDHPRGVLVVDAGTAVTYEVISSDGIYRGGVISAGPAILSSALSGGAAQLSAVSLRAPTSPVGRSTQEALQSGIMYGFVDSVAGMIERLCKQETDNGSETRPLVVATGGWGPWLKEHVATIDAVEPHLVLHGIHDLLMLNRETAR